MIGTLEVANVDALSQLFSAQVTLDCLTPPHHELISWTVYVLLWHIHRYFLQQLLYFDSSLLKTQQLYEPKVNDWDLNIIRPIDNMIITEQH